MMSRGRSIPHAVTVEGELRKRALELARAQDHKRSSDMDYSLHVQIVSALALASIAESAQVLAKIASAAMTNEERARAANDEILRNLRG